MSIFSCMSRRKTDAAALTTEATTRFETNTKPCKGPSRSSLESTSTSFRQGPSRSSLISTVESPGGALVVHMNEDIPENSTVEHSEDTFDDDAPPIFSTEKSMTRATTNLSTAYRRRSSFSEVRKGFSEDEESDMLKSRSEPSKSTLTRRNSSFTALLFSRPKASNVSSSMDQEFTTDMRRITNAISFKHKLLINELLTAPGDCSIKIRFINSVDQYLCEEDVTKKEKMGRTICKLFVRGEMFKITTFSSEVGRELAKLRVEYLEEAKREMVLELSLNAFVMRAVEYVEGIDY